MILVALGSNVAGPWGTPRQTIKKALEKLDKPPCRVLRASSLIITAPFGVENQPDFVNAVAVVDTQLTPNDLMAHLHDIELSADRRRTVRWGPRTLDLDLVDYNGCILDGKGETVGHQKPLQLPHPGIAERDFVLGPIAEIAPHWKHPRTGLSAREMLKNLHSLKP